MSWSSKPQGVAPHHSPVLTLPGPRGIFARSFELLGNAVGRLINQSPVGSGRFGLLARDGMLCYRVGSQEWPDQSCGVERTQDGKRTWITISVDEALGLDRIGRRRLRCPAWHGRVKPMSTGPGGVPQAHFEPVGLVAKLDHSPPVRETVTVVS